MKTIKIKNIVFKNLRFVFLFILLIFFLRFDGYQPISENFIHYSNHLDTELVISEELEDDLTIDISDLKLKRLNNFEITILPDYQLSLKHFNQSINCRFITINKRFIQYYSFYSVIHKNNIWHQNIFDVSDFSC